MLMHSLTNMFHHSNVGAPGYDPSSCTFVKIETSFI